MQQSLLATAGKAVAVYIVMLLVMRILGKRAVGNFSAFDLLVALMLGDMVGNTIFNSVSLQAGLTGIVTVAALEYGNSWLSYLGLNGLLEGTPTIIVDEGESQDRGMRKERMNRHDIMGVLREHGITDIRQIKLAVVEADGHLSVIEREWSMPAEKADVSEIHAKERERHISLDPRALHATSTISPQALPRD